MTALAWLGVRTAVTAAAFEVDIATDFESLARRYPALRDDIASNDFFSNWAWFENLSHHGIEPELERLLVTVREKESDAVFCLPLLRRPGGAAAPYGPVVSGLSNYYSSLYGVIGDSRHLNVEALRAAFSHLRRVGGPCGVIDLQPLDIEHPFYDLVAKALQAEGFVTDSYFCFGNWQLDVAGRSFADYLPTIPSRLRNTILRGRKKLSAGGAWSVQVHTSAGPELDDAIADFEAIYAKSWKVSEPFPRFVPQLCRAAANREWLRLGILRVERQPIAAQIWIVRNRRALIYKLAYDEGFKHFSAGSVLSAELMRRAIDEDRVVNVDYLTGDDGYKVDWMSDRRERRGVVAFDLRSVQGLSALVKHRAGAWLRRRKQGRVTNEAG